VPRAAAAVLLTYVALTIVVTYPQVLSMGTAVPYHTDPYFSMWRLGWVAHAIVHSPTTLFDANIFYPEHHTLAYSDAMLLPGVVLAPLFWAHVNPVAIYNCALLAAFAISGVSAFALARHLTGNTIAALIGGAIYAFAPYRFGHYMHLELQIVFWCPIALLLIHKLLSSGSVRDGVLLGATIGAQVLCSIYTGIFLVMYCVVFAPCVWMAAGAQVWRRHILALVAGAAVTTLLVLPYAPAYLGARNSVGTRSLEEVGRYSATVRNYVAAPAMNRIYGWTAISDPLAADEMNLFPGIAAVALAMLGIAVGRSRVRLAYVAGLVFAIAISAGTHGLIFPWLFEHVPLFRGLRSPARFAVFVNLSLAVLSAYGAAFLLERMRSQRAQRVLAGVISAAVIVEYASAPSLSAAPAPTRVDAQLAQKPPSVIVELPLVSDKGVWLSLDFIYMYQSLAHFQRMLNGYSGFAPASFYQMRDVMTSFPDDRSMAFLRGRGVDYIVVRLGIYDPQQAAELLQRLHQRLDLTLDMMWMTGPQGPEAIFKVVK
jgi:hypothetical protein